NRRIVEEAVENKAAPKGAVVGGPLAKKYMWILGEVKKGPHCKDCLDRHGKSKTLLEWLRMTPPKCNCHCSMAEVGVDVAADYKPPIPPVPVENRWALPWGDKARAASLAVRRARAATRKAYLGQTYPDGSPVIPDLTDFSPGPPAGVSMRAWTPEDTAGDDLARRTARDAYSRLQDVQLTGATTDPWADAFTTVMGLIPVAGYSGGGRSMRAMRRGVSSTAPHEPRPTSEPLPAAARPRPSGSGPRLVLTATQLGALIQRLGNQALDLLYPGGKGPTSGPVAETDAELAARRRALLSLYWGTVGKTGSSEQEAEREARLSRELAGVPPELRGNTFVQVAQRLADWYMARSVNKAALIAAIEKARGVVTEIEGRPWSKMTISMLKEYYKSIGGNPDEVIPKMRVEPVPTDSPAFNELRKRYGIRLEERPLPASKKIVPTPAEVREGFAEYLLEALGDRPGNVDDALFDGERYMRSAARALGKAKADLMDAQRAAMKARRDKGEWSPEFEKAIKDADAAKWDFEHVSAANERFEQEYLSLRRAVDDYVEAAKNGNPFDWGEADLDYNAILQAARRNQGKLTNRWPNPAAWRASLAVRRAKAAARLKQSSDWLLRGGLTPGAKTGDEEVSKKKSKKDPATGEEVFDASLEEGVPSPVRSGACYNCGAEGHWASECPLAPTGATKENKAAKRKPTGKLLVPSVYDLGLDLFREKYGREAETVAERQEVRKLGKDASAQLEQLDPAGAADMVRMKKLYGAFQKAMDAAGADGGKMQAAVIWYLRARHDDGRGLDMLDGQAVREYLARNPAVTPGQRARAELILETVDGAFRTNILRGDNVMRVKQGFLGGNVAEYLNAYDAGDARKAREKMERAVFVK
ncbi:MAG: zinc finger CCHC domain-containing protein, partial [bacterium]